MAELIFKKSERGQVIGYEKRPVRFIEIVECNGWKIKLYSISVKSEKVSASTIELAKQYLPQWMQNTSLYEMDTYKAATLILHEGREGCFAVISWWIDENMLQLFAFLASDDKPNEFNLYSDKGIVCCVWEMAVLWFERNSWVNKVLAQPDNPNAMENYLAERLNADV